MIKRTTVQYIPVTRIHSHNVCRFVFERNKLLETHNISSLQLPVNSNKIRNMLHLEKALRSWQVKAPVFRSAQKHLLFLSTPNELSGIALQLTGKFAGLLFSKLVVNY